MDTFGLPCSVKNESWNLLFFDDDFNFKNLNTAKFTTNNTLRRSYNSDIFCDIGNVNNFAVLINIVDIQSSCSRSDFLRKKVSIKHGNDLLKKLTYSTSFTSSKFLLIKLSITITISLHMIGMLISSFLYVFP